MSVKYRDQLIYELASNIVNEFDVLMDIISMLHVLTDFNKSLKNKYKLIPTTLYKNEAYAKYDKHYNELIELLRTEESKQTQWIFDSDLAICDKLKQNIKLLTKLIKDDVENMLTITEIRSIADDPSLVVVKNIKTEYDFDSDIEDDFYV
jgi:hypothetical protein